MRNPGNSYDGRAVNHALLDPTFDDLVTGQVDDGGLVDLGKTLLQTQSRTIVELGVDVKLELTFAEGLAYDVSVTHSDNNIFSILMGLEADLGVHSNHSGFNGVLAPQASHCRKRNLSSFTIFVSGRPQVGQIT